MSSEIRETLQVAGGENLAESLSGRSDPDAVLACSLEEALVVSHYAGEIRPQTLRGRQMQGVQRPKGGGIDSARIIKDLPVQRDGLDFREQPLCSGRGSGSGPPCGTAQLGTVQIADHPVPTL